MRKILIAGCIMFCATASLIAKSANKANRDQKSLAFIHVTVIDATGAPPKSDMTVVVSRDKIVSIGKTSSTPVSEATVVDGSGKFLLPGFWDMHAHLSNYGVNALKLLVDYGVTGVRDLGSDIWQIDPWREQIRSGRRIGPEIIRAGPIVDGVNPIGQFRLTVTTPEEGRCAVQTLKTGLHTDLVKVHASLPRDAFFALASEARKLGMPLACHLPVNVEIREASTAGCNSIEHVAESFLESLLRSEKLKTTEEAVDALLSKPGLEIFAALVKNNTWVDPTLIGYKAFVRMAERCPTPQPKTEWCMQPEEFDQKELDAREAVFRHLIEAVGIMHRQGVRLLAGSDFSDKEEGSVPGLTLHQELQLFVKAGLTPLEAIKVGTHDAAEYLGKLSERGTIEQGKIADLVLLNKDPLADISNTTAIDMVVVRGRIVKTTSRK